MDVPARLTLDSLLTSDSSMKMWRSSPERSLCLHRTLQALSHKCRPPERLLPVSIRSGTNTGTRTIGTTSPGIIRTTVAARDTAGARARASTDTDRVPAARTATAVGLHHANHEGTTSVTDKFPEAPFRDLYYRLRACSFLYNDMWWRQQQEPYVRPPYVMMHPQAGSLP